LEIVDLTRKAMPEDMPLFFRISATDWLEQEKDMESWKLEDTVRLADILADRGVDLIGKLERQRCMIITQTSQMYLRVVTTPSSTLTLDPGTRR